MKGGELQGWKSGVVLEGCEDGVVNGWWCLRG